MTPTLQRVVLAILAFSGIVVGPWAYLAPRNWYDTFPGMGLSWLPQLGPFNEHFVKDVGAFYLALAVLSVLAAIHVTNTVLVRATAATWTVFNLLHLIYHLQMLHMYQPRDQILNAIVLSTVLVAALALFMPRKCRPPRVRSGT